MHRRIKLGQFITAIFLLLNTNCGRLTLFSNSDSAASGPSLTQQQCGAISTTIAPLPGTPTALARPSAMVPRKWLYGPIKGSGCGLGGTPCAQSGWDIGDQFKDDINNLTQNNIPISSYDFDGASWSYYPTVSTTDADKCLWRAGTDVIDILRANGLRAILHYWGGCRTVPEFNLALSTLGNDVFGGFYFDDGTSDTVAINAVNWTNQNLPNSGIEIMKTYMSNQSYYGYGDPEVPDGSISLSTLTTYGNVAYVNDLYTDFNGLQTGIQRVFAQSVNIPAPYNEFTGYDGNPPDKETYLRRLHFGALQVVMHHITINPAEPWLALYATDTTAPGIDLVERYRFWSWIHTELAPYLYSYEWDNLENGDPIFRNPDANSYSTQLGNEIFVAYVTSSGVTDTTVPVPQGNWVSMWDMSSVTGGQSVDLPAPLGQEPVLYKKGSIIPLNVSQNYTGHGTAESAGSLTALVIPDSTASFHYRDETNGWVTLGEEITNGNLILSASSPVSQSLIWRVETWPSKPSAVSVCGTVVAVGSNSSPIPQAASEAAVNGASTATWFYDPQAQRLIVKIPH